MNFLPKHSVAGHGHAESGLRVPASTRFDKFSRNVVTRLILGGTTLIVGIAAYSSYQAVRHATLDNLKQNAWLKVARGADEIDQWIALRKSEVAAIASMPIARTMDWNQIKPDFAAEQQRLHSFEPLLGIITPQGKFFNLLKGETKINLRDRLHFQRGMAGLSTVMDPLISRVNGKRIIVFAAPIWSDSSTNPAHKPLGVINAPIDIQKITAVVRNLKYGNGSYAFALNSKGEAITHPNTALMSTLEKPAPSLLISNDTGLAQIAQHMVNRRQGIDFVSLAEGQRYVAFIPLQEANWSVALVIAQDAIESQLRLLDGIAFIVLSLVGALIGTLMYVQSMEQHQLKKSKLAADAANQAKSEFLANMSHELRTPLNGILGYAQILGRSKTLGEKEQRGVHIIHQCGSHLLTLINDILDLSKIEARKLELSPKSFHLGSFLQSVVEICRLRAEQKGLEFVYHVDDQLPAGITADEKRLRQVLINLLSNAIKFTDRGGVSFTVEGMPSAIAGMARVRFRVTDTGVGIAPADLARLFQAFEQVGDRKRQIEGTGLGLAISQRIVQLMGSQIQVKSYPGEGSNFTFEVEFPIANDWVHQSTIDSGKRILGYAGQTRTILVIDDRWENRAVLENLLEPLGFVVAEAEHGLEGLQKLQSGLPDLVITDLAMPVMDGFELLQQIRQTPNLKALKVLVASASVAQMDQQKALDAGGDDFLAKPIDVSELFKLIAKHLDLEWNYEDTNTQEYTEQKSTDAIVLPPMEELNTLLELSQQDNLRELRQRLESLNQLSEEYVPFTAPILKLVQQFKGEEIENLLQTYLAEMTTNA